MIDSQLLDAYVAELQALRDYGGEFASSYPAIASRLDIGPRPSRDPSVERMVQSAALLTARLRLMVESQAAEIPLAILGMIAPAITEPVPSMGMLELVDGSEPQLIRRGSRFDFQAGGQALACFATTMDIIAGNAALEVARLGPTGRYVDGLALRIRGATGGQPLFCLGADELGAAALMDAIDTSLAVIEVALPNGETRRLPPSALRFHGFGADEAALPSRPAGHRAHRIVIEYLVFPAKFRLISISSAPTPPGTEIRLLFSAPLPLPAANVRNLVSTNRVPVVNLWSASGTPFEISGRALEYPVRADALRYRTVECHSVQGVSMYDGAGELHALDPVVGLGDVRDTPVRWGMRRTTTNNMAEVLVYFEGLDYGRLGQEALFAVPSVLASNRDIAERVPAGARLAPVDSAGDWVGRLVTAPTRYRPAVVGPAATQRLIGYLQSSMGSFGGGPRRRYMLRDYLRHFPGAADAGWINGLGPLAFRQIAAVRGNEPQPGLALIVDYNKREYRTTSAAMVKRVLALLIDSQRGLNKVEEIIVRTT